MIATEGKEVKLVIGTTLLSQYSTSLLYKYRGIVETIFPYFGPFMNLRIHPTCIFLQNCSVI